MARVWASIRLVLVCALGCVVAACVSAPAGDKEIALTIDDAPLPPGPFLTGPERMHRLIASLHRARVREAAFFVNPGRPEPDRDARYHAYAAAGHVIANHSWDHPNLAHTTAEDYIANIQRADAFLRPLRGFKPWFRFPYLSEGETVGQRDAVRQALIRMGYAQGYVTTDSYDWYLDQLTRDAHAAGKTMDMNALRDVYVNSAVEGAEFDDRMARAVLGHPVRQVMLMHENDIEAMYLPDMVAALRAHGWRIITATEAFSDPIATELPDTLALGQGRIAAMMYAQNATARFPEHRPNYDALDGAFETRVLHQPAR